jgi:hypothetical protein
MTTIYDEKKEGYAMHVQEADVGGITPSSSSDTDKERQEPPLDTRLWEDIDEGFDPAEVKRTMRKVDWNLIPILSAMYCISLIDRTNLSIARASNQKAMNKDLGLDKGDRYSIATMIFFVPYVSFIPEFMPEHGRRT